MVRTMQSDTTSSDDPELRDGPKQDLHSLRARDEALDALSDEVQTSAAARAAAAFLRETSDVALLRKLLGGKPVLVTGSAGYLGRALHLTLQKLGIGVVGVDVVPGATVDRIADVADVEAMRLCGLGACGAVLHTAALHAPHALSWHAREFHATNVVGTANVLALKLPTVHTSTTSLTITGRVKAREKAGELVWLDEHSQRPDVAAAEDDDTAYDESLDAPRNKYGRTKLQGEQRCLDAARDSDADVVVLRTPRFFPEDVLEESDLPLPNVKANELLGRRSALADLVDAHLRALARIRNVRGLVLTLAAPWPLKRPDDAPGETKKTLSAIGAAGALRERFPHAARLFSRHGWSLPDAVTRVYDADAAVLALGWRPRVTFEALLEAMLREEEEEETTSKESSSKRRKVDGLGEDHHLVLEELLCGKSRLHVHVHVHVERVDSR